VRKNISLFLSLITLAILVLYQTQKVSADDSCAKISDLDARAKCYEDKITKKESEYESTSNKLSDIQGRRDGIKAKLTSLNSQLGVTESQITDLSDEIASVRKELATIQTNINDRKTKLDQKTILRNRIVRNYAKQSNDTSFGMFLMGNGFEKAAMSNAFSKAISSQTKKIMEGLNFEIFNFEQDRQKAEDIKTELESDFNDLAALKTKLASEKNQQQSADSKLANEETTTKGKLANLQNEISDLSAKQKEILNQKYGDSNGSVGDYESPTASTPNPPFKPAFAVFSYGAYTHYNGMSQYGAKGRADKGQKYKEILKFYYKVDTEKKDGFPSKISVKGYGDLDFQYYLYGLAEMPTDWPIEALKAQAIAGRSYAYRANKPICTTQSCQVFNKAKADKVKAGQYPNWKKAVDDTKAEILKNPTTAQYSSTTGGYINNVGWDINGKWPNDAYEKLAKSPWFYKAWYTKNYSTSDSCGRGHPWLSEKEMADILNAYVVWNDGSSSDQGHISPVTTSCWGGDPYSLDEMASKADKYGTKYSKVTGVDVDISNGGYTSKVYLDTDKGRVTVDGETFKTVFNLRAPGYVSIKSKLFDLEQRN